MQDSTLIGRDVRKVTVLVAVAQGERGGKVLPRGQFRTVRITSASCWTSWPLKVAGCVFVLKHGIAAMACTGNLLR